MTRITALALAALLGAGSVAPAQAQLARTFVSAASGNDANDCNRLTPCRTFQRAHDNTLSAGEITVLDPGGYGAVAITKALSIINDGVGEAGVLVSGGTGINGGITVNAGDGDAVSLRGLTIKGIGFGGGNGIVFNRGKSLTLENCVVRRMDGVFPNGFGIRLLPRASSTFAVSNTIVTDSITGISLQPSGATTVVTAVFAGVELYNNSGGLVVSGQSGARSVAATVTDSVAAGNKTSLLVATGTPSTPASLMVVRSVVANNGFGIGAVGASATLRVSQTTIAANQSALATESGGVIASYGDNYVVGNGAGTETPTTTIARQ
jgi:hypothetical protein